MNQLSIVLSQLMSLKKINSAELARKTGVSQPVIYRLMTGATDNPQILTLKPIADFFKISIDQLMGFNPLSTSPSYNSASLHHLNNKLTTIKTIVSVLAELLPSLIEAYKTALANQLIKEEISTDILPLLPINLVNLLKTANQLQEMLTPNQLFQEEV